MPSPLYPLRRTVLLVGAIAGLVSCSDSPSEPLMPTSTIHIILSALERDGSLFEVILDGGASTINWVECVDVAKCPSTPRTSRPVKGHQIDVLASRFIRAGIRDVYRAGSHEVDFGTCDGCEHPVYYRVHYLDLSQWVELRGDIQSFPDGYRDAVEELVEFALSR